MGAWEMWKRSLEAIEALAPTVVVPGHGDVLIGKEAIHREVQRIKTILDRAIATGKAPTRE